MAWAVLRAAAAGLEKVLTEPVLSMRPLILFYLLYSLFFHLQKIREK
jgi:hypothetical protein